MNYSRSHFSFFLFLFPFCDGVSLWKPQAVLEPTLRSDETQTHRVLPAFASCELGLNSWATSHYSMYVCECMCRGQKTTWVNFSFCLEGSEDWTQIIRLSGKHLYLLTHLSDQSCVHVQTFTLIFLFFLYFRRFGDPFIVIKKLSWLCLNLPSPSWVLNLYASNFFFTWKKSFILGQA